jgi:hypothetical protein
MPNTNFWRKKKKVELTGISIQALTMFRSSLSMLYFLYVCFINSSLEVTFWIAFIITHVCICLKLQNWSPHKCYPMPSVCAFVKCSPAYEMYIIRKMDTQTRNVIHYLHWMLIMPCFISRMYRNTIWHSLTKTLETKMKCMFQEFSVYIQCLSLHFKFW